MTKAKNEVFIGYQEQPTLSIKKFLFSIDFLKKYSSHSHNFQFLFLSRVKSDNKMCSNILIF